MPISSIAAAAAAAEMMNPRDAPGPFEHLHLHMVRTHWATKHHENLGALLQGALDILDIEGWEVVAAFNTGTMPDVILRRRRPAAG